MRSAFAKDVLRSVRDGRRRFISIAVIVLLGVTVTLGLQMFCRDLRYTADDFFQSQLLYDIKVQSTLGLTDEDVEALLELDGVDIAEGTWSETAYTEIEGELTTTTVCTLMDSGMNQPYVLTGSLPTSDDEIVVTKEYLEDTGKEIGDTLTFAVDSDVASSMMNGEWDFDAVEEDEEDDDSDDLDSLSDDESTEVFVLQEYTIVGTVTNPADVATKTGSSSFRTTGPKYTFYVTKGATDSDVYTEIYVRITGSSELYSFSDKYEEEVAEVSSQIESIKSEREEARYLAVVADATEQIDDAEEEAEEELADAEQQLDDAQAEIDDGLAELEDALAEIEEQVEALDDAESQLPGDQDDLDEALAQVEEAQEELDEAAAQWEEQREELESQLAEAQSGLDTLNSAIEQLETTLAALYSIESPTEEQAAQIAALEAQLAALQEQAATVEAAIAQIEAGIEQGDAAIAEAQATIDETLAGLAEWQSGIDQIESGREAIEEALAQIEDGLAELEDGQAELDENRATFESEKADALAKIADAREEVEEISTAQWYVLDRTTLSCFSGIDSDASSIEAIASVFPVIFFIVAILVSLTAVARMVEEDRGLIGLYKALGYSNARIYGKYVVYVLGACVLGSIFGLLFGFVIMPDALFSIMRLMYDLPAYNIYFNGPLCALALGLFCGGLTLASVITCRGVLRSRPATLMRPKAPKAGTRIFLERITPFWKRLKFLDKVTARNLFRYKQRFLMTVFGVMGCTALMILGFAIYDSVNALSPNQYGDDTREGIVQYDLMVVVAEDDLEEAAEQLTESDEVESYTAVLYDSVTVYYDGSSESMQIMVVPDDFSIEGYVRLVTQDGTEYDMSALEESESGIDNAVFLTKNASMMLGFSSGDTVTIQDSQLQQADVEVVDILMSYLSNTVYMTQSTYESVFGTTPEANTLLATLTGDSEEQIAFAESLRGDTLYLTVTSIAEQVRDFTANFSLINYVVLLIIGLAAALAFVVLFTLSTTNISERERELATIKVLGFRKHEVRTYINKEMILLSIIGVILGIPAGALIGHSMTWILVMPSMYFAVEIHPIGYVVSCILSIVFAIIVSLIANRSLDRIDMVGALKSAE